MWGAEYINMRYEIKKVFGNPSARDDNVGTLAVKEECKFRFGRNKYLQGYRKSEFRGNSKVTFWEEGRESKGKQKIGERKPRRTNPLDKCHECDSTKHFASRCPDRMSLGHVEPSANIKENDGA